LLRPVQLHRIEPHLHAVTIGACRNLPIGGKQRQLAVPLAPFIEGFDQAVPSLKLTIIDLAEIQHLSMDHLATGATLVFDNIPVSVFFAVFDASVESQDHANQPTPASIGEKGTWSTLQPIGDRAQLIRLAFSRRRPAKTAIRGRQVVKLG
jgi:hypothetical protein